jgi:hypothetical protein
MICTPGLNAPSIPLTGKFTVQEVRLRDAGAFVNMYRRHLAVPAGCLQRGLLPRLRHGTAGGLKVASVECKPERETRSLVLIERVAIIRQTHPPDWLHVPPIPKRN